MSPSRFTKLFTRRCAKKNPSTSSITSLGRPSAQHSATQSLDYLRTHMPPPLGQTEGRGESNTRVKGFSNDSDYEDLDEIDEMSAELDDGLDLYLAPTTSPGPMALLPLTHGDEITYPGAEDFLQVMEQEIDDDVCEVHGSESDWTKVIKPDCLDDVCDDDVCEPDTTRATVKSCTSNDDCLTISGNDSKGFHIEEPVATSCIVDDDHVMISEDDVNDTDINNPVPMWCSTEDDTEATDIAEPVPKWCFTEDGTEDTEINEPVPEWCFTDDDDAEDIDVNEPVPEWCFTEDDHVMISDHDAEKDPPSAHHVEGTQAEQTTCPRIHPLFRAKYVNNEFFSKMDMKPIHPLFRAKYMDNEFFSNMDMKTE
ncbi:hypothetical protein F5Y18DRAFT_423016 [Xylariaceae sp. FL1019]|nr:hypothetical protein F5Y18DRAFT_423016 [Xylariaceae sp. FL1019]